MSKLPWDRDTPERHGRDDGTEDLQSDVMRFMAILALCLVAVFALVQGVPRASRPGEGDIRAAPAPAKPSAAPRPAGLVEQPASLPRPKAPPAPSPPAPTSGSTGYSLRFASDDVLFRLVGQDRVRVYALAKDRAWRLATDQGALRFYQTVKPLRLHGMAGETVPTAMASALRQSVMLSSSESVTWGVTLPDATRRSVAALMSSRPHGSLVIHGNAQVAWEDSVTTKGAGGS